MVRKHRDTLSGLRPRSSRVLLLYLVYFAAAVAGQRRGLRARVRYVKFLKLMTVTKDKKATYVGWHVEERGSLDTARAAGTEYFLLVLTWVATL